MPRTATGCAACDLFGGEVRTGHISRARADAQAAEASGTLAVGLAAAGCIGALAAVGFLAVRWGAEMFAHAITAFTAGCSRRYVGVFGGAPHPLDSAKGASSAI